jgi:hypothetical protein
MSEARPAKDDEPHQARGQDGQGWVYSYPGGVYGTDYLQRATVAFYGLGLQSPPGRRLSDVRDDRPRLALQPCLPLHDTKGQLPPVDGFWSLTTYDGDYSFVANPLNRYTVSQRNQLKENEDGSVTIYVQNESPGTDKESNWLPAPKGKFV